MGAPRLVHLLGICGTGMGSFAGLLKAAGYVVRGSDENVYPPMSTKLADWGIEVREGYRPENLDPEPDLVIVGNVIKRQNPEVQAVMERGLAYTSFPKAIGELFLEKRHSIVVSGTHGKTTTTTMIAWLLTHAGRDPSMLVGGVPGNFDEGFRLGQGEEFVIEGDEYDTAYFDKVPKFLHYHPKTVIITSLEYDHADIYPDVESIEREFDKLVALVPPEGHIIACASSERVPPRLVAAHSKVETYSAAEGVQADWTVRDVESTPEGVSFTAVQNNKIPLGRFFLPMSGRHNVENALAAVVAAIRRGLSQREITAALREFKGIARRQTVRAVVSGVTIIDDFAHHPTAVRATVEAMRNRYSGKLVAVFEPRTATSSRAYFQDAYTQAFDPADEVIVARVGRPEIDPSERLDTEKLCRDIAARGTPAHNIESVDEIVADIAARAEDGMVVLIMSNGGFGGIYEKLEKALESRA